TDEAIAQLKQMAQQSPEMVGADLELGDLLREKKRFGEAVTAYDEAIRRAARALGDVLRSRRRARALAPVGARRARPASRAAAQARPADGAQLSRLFMDRPRPEPRPRPQDDRKGGRAPARRRLHHRQPGLGALPHGRLRRRGALSRKGDRAGAGGSDDQRPPRRCLLAGPAADRGALSMAPGAAIRPRGKGDKADRGQAGTRRDQPAALGARRLNRSFFAPAKINLYLHVTGRRADGYHLLDSLIAFADIGDRVAAAPAEMLSLRVTGPEAAAVAGLGDDNLVLRAARHLQARAGIRAGAKLTLDKHLPAASGIGGGSSDAAAALRALAYLWGCRIDPREPATASWAAELGADVPACLAAMPLRIGGIGEILEPVGTLPPLGIVLANPRRELPTAAVFRARHGEFGAPAPPRGTADPIDWLQACRNDLTAAAIGL